MIYKRPKDESFSYSTFLEEISASIIKDLLCLVKRKIENLNLDLFISNSEYVGDQLEIRDELDEIF